MRYALTLVFVMLFAQFYFVTDGSLRFKSDENRRILAAACFLIENRPDLLAPGKTPFLSGGTPTAKATGRAGAVPSYMRGRSEPIIIPLEFPATRFGTRNPAPLDALVHAYKNENKILADWIILGSEAVSDTNPARDFFRRFLNDPNVRWIARFREDNGEEIYIGEVSNGRGAPASQAPLMDVKTLSDRYEAIYDRMRFLKQNVEYVWRY